MGRTNCISNVPPQGPLSLTMKLHVETTQSYQLRAEGRSKEVEKFILAVDVCSRAVVNE